MTKDNSGKTGITAWTDVKKALAAGFSAKRALSSDELAHLASQLYFTLDAGIPVSRGIAMVRPRSRSSRLNKLLPGIERGMSGGESLYSALEKTGVFPNFFVHMVRVGEESGMLADIMRRLADYCEKEARTSEELKSAMLYPAMVSVLMLGVIAIAMLTVIPGYARIFESGGVELPAATGALIAISGFITRNGGVIISVLIAAALGLYCFLQTAPGVYLKHRLFLCSKIYVKALNQRFAQALELLLISGSDPVRSVGVSKNVVDNRIMESGLQQALERMIRGMAFGTALDEAGYFDDMLIAMIRLGEETGRLTLTVGKCADRLQKELDAAIVRVNKLVEPVITLVLGAVLAFIMLAIMLPTFHMANIL